MSVFIQVAFAGHNRPEDLGDAGVVREGLDAAFARLHEAGIAHGRLFCGLAAGADVLAVERWRHSKLGSVHLVLPFLDDSQCPEPPDAVGEMVTRLDGAAVEAEGRNPHLQQTRLIVEAADIVVVVWNGAAAKGAGGTADAVLYALELARPVLWINPADGGRVRLIQPEPLPIDFHFLEFLEGLAGPEPRHVMEPTPEALRAALSLGHAAADDEEDDEGAKSVRLMDHILHRYAWRTYALFRRFAGGKISVPPAPDVETPASLRSQPGFTVLTRAYHRWDRVANRLSAVHRSEQLLLVMAMIAAAVIGSAWAIWPEFKLTAVWIEMGLSIGALLVWASASDTKQHERWSQARFLAEQLRLARAGWALGLSIDSAAPGTPHSHLRQEREVRRAAGLPTGDFDAERVQDWGLWAMNELIQGQAAYHHGSGIRDGRIAHRIHKLEDASFVCLFAVFALYLAVHFTPFGHRLPAWTAGVVSLVGTTMPAISASTMALDSKLEFQEQSARSRTIAHTLEALAQALGARPTFDGMRHAARVAMRLHIAEANHWREGSNRRRLFRP
ncbi:MAG: hypothetical protein ACXU82_00520 [Caulobacteraceae bacterium]